VAVNALSVRAQQPARATIEGVVVNGATGEPVAGARVQISADSGVARPAVVDMVMAALASSGPTTMLMGGSSNPSKMTAADGKFSFTVDPGMYRVAVDASGFAPAEFGQRTPSAAGTVIHAESGTPVTPLTVRLTPTGALTGRILNDAGMPADQVPVQILRVAYNRFGQRFMEVGAADVTNNRGEFRLNGITPARYYMNAGGIPAAIPQSGTLSFLGSNQAYTSSYYPGVTDFNRAVLLEIKPGVELNADMNVFREMRTRVSGRVIDSRTGKPPESGSITLSYRQPTGGTAGTVRQLASTGLFDFSGVIPGNYTLQASAPDAYSLSRQRALAASASFADQLAADLLIPRGRVTLTVTGVIDGVVVAISAPAVMEGRLTVNGEPASGLPNPERVRLGLWQLDNGGVLPFGPSAQAAADGTFIFDSVPAGEYKLGITGLPAGFYIEKAEINGADILNDGVTLPSASRTLEVVLQRGTGSLRGTLADTQSRPASGVEVVLVPEQRRRLDLYKTAITDKNGRFTIAEIPPGSYRLFSWEALEPYGYYDPDVLSRDEARSTVVRVAASSSNTVDVQVIPLGP
jgi:5-hydroxyisourate hydrolase-like protein (transthyretin family)